jgi:cbb3-type cytochrome oxidase maturation protein
MYFPIWMILVVFSLGISIMAFLWGLQSGQFSDQERARFLPLYEAPPQPMVPDPAKLTVEVYVLLGIGVMVLVGIIFSLVLSFYR